MKPNTLISLDAYKGKKVLITGGLGFIGSNLAHRLVALGAQVSILDNLDPRYGGNLFNVASIKDHVQLFQYDVCNYNVVEMAVQGQDIIFHLAAQVSHSDSGKIPHDDLKINVQGTLTVLEVCRQLNPTAKIMFASSRLVLGKIKQTVINEHHPVNPLSLYGLHKSFSENYCQFYHRHYGLRTTVFRITNPYGERQQIKHHKYSMPGWFLRLAMENKVIQIYGNGSQLRDYIHINDLTEAFLRAAITEATDGELYNCGFGSSVPFIHMAEWITLIVGSGTIQNVPWPENYEKEETGNCEMDISKLRNVIGWSPTTTIEQGIRSMYDYYQKHWDQYV